MDVSTLAPLLQSSRTRMSDGILIDETFERAPVSAIDAHAYDERSRTFDRTKAFERKRPGFTKPLKTKGHDAVFLEIACGRAAHSLTLLHEGYRVIASDISEQTVRWVRETAKDLGLDTHGGFAVLDAGHLPFADHALDGVFMISCLHHFPSAEGVLRECKRVLKKDGVLLIGYEPSRWSYTVFSPLWKFLKRILRKKDVHRAVSVADDVTMGFSIQELQTIVLNSGFTDIRITGVDYFEKIYEHIVVFIRKLMGLPDSEYRPRFRLLQWIDTVLGKLPIIRHASWNYDISAVAS